MPATPLHTIFLTTADVKFCQHIADERRKRNNQAGVRDQSFSRTESNEAKELRGIIGEFAFLKMMDQPIEPLLDTHPRSAYNDTFDAVVDGKSIDVKTTYITHKGIIATMKKSSNPADFYCFMLVQHSNLRKVEFYGFIAGKDFIHPRRIMYDRGHGRHEYVAPLDDLVSWHELNPQSRCPCRSHRDVEDGAVVTFGSLGIDTRTCVSLHASPLSAMDEEEMVEPEVCAIEV